MANLTYFRIPQDAPEVEALPVFVSVCLEDMAYGGPEEGGWYYHTSERIESHYAATPRALAAILARMERDYSNEGRREISSVLSDGQYCIIIGDEPAAQYDPERRPHYE